MFCKASAARILQNGKYVANVLNTLGNKYFVTDKKTIISEELLKVEKKVN